MQIAVSDGGWPAILFSRVTFFRDNLCSNSLVAMTGSEAGKTVSDPGMGQLVIVLALALPVFMQFPSKPLKKCSVDSQCPNSSWVVVMSAVNPVQIPFWFGWSNRSFTKKILCRRAIIIFLYHRDWTWYAGRNSVFYFRRAFNC